MFLARLSRFALMTNHGLMNLVDEPIMINRLNLMLGGVDEHVLTSIYMLSLDKLLTEFTIELREHIMLISRGS